MEEMTTLQTWLQIGTNTGFVGLAWYLIVIALPKMQERCDNYSEMQLSEFREQVKDIIERHERAVQTITTSHERQIEIIRSFKSCSEKKP